MNEKIGKKPEPLVKLVEGEDGLWPRVDVDSLRAKAGEIAEELEGYKTNVEWWNLLEERVLHGLRVYEETQSLLQTFVPSVVLPSWEKVTITNFSERLFSEMGLRGAGCGLLKDSRHCLVLVELFAPRLLEEEALSSKSSVLGKHSHRFIFASHELGHAALSEMMGSKYAERFGKDLGSAEAIEHGPDIPLGTILSEAFALQYGRVAYYLLSDIEKKMSSDAVVQNSGPEIYMDWRGSGPEHNMGEELANRIFSSQGLRISSSLAKLEGLREFYSTIDFESVEEVVIKIPDASKTLFHILQDPVNNLPRK